MVYISKFSFNGVNKTCHLVIIKWTTGDLPPATQKVEGGSTTNPNPSMMITYIFIYLLVGVKTRFKNNLITNKY